MWMEKLFISFLVVFPKYSREEPFEIGYIFIWTIKLQPTSATKLKQYEELIL